MASRESLQKPHDPVAARVKEAVLVVVNEHGEVLHYRVAPYLDSKSTTVYDLTEGINSELDFRCQPTRLIPKP